jgi:hypothetical protein
LRAEVTPASSSQKSAVDHRSQPHPLHAYM